MAQRSEPFQQERCGRESYLLCTTGGKASCCKEGVDRQGLLIRVVEKAGW